ncbi:MAG TPA: hypothetical protein VFM05_07530 [Candidatus Saccharimonadales bacterium]|nr:hypothetical protein [Candidatus Saccharimonadales bacterium]
MEVVTHRLLLLDWSRFPARVYDETTSNYILQNYLAKVSGSEIECTASIPVLVLHPYIVEIAQTYLNNYLMPQTLTGDALHLAYASYYKMDFLLTWNCNHLANANKKQHIRIINARMNLSTPEIVTPLELFTETSDDD